MKHRKDLQGLRGIAVLLVVFAHAGMPFFQGGFIGVDLFFVLSGYLISAQIIQDKIQGRFSLIYFYSKRIRRLSPALIFVVLVTVGIVSLLLSSIEAEEQLRSLPYALSWTSNIYFSFREIDYFNESLSRDFFLHTWSLGVEEQFYIIWPFIISVSLILSRATGWKLFYPFLVIVLIGFFSSAYFVNIYPNHVFYQTIFRGWQFGLGALVYLATSNQYVQPVSRLSSLLDRTITLKILQNVFLLSIFACAVLYSQTIFYPGINAVLPSVSAAGLIYVGSSSRHSSKLMENNLLVWLGDRSYSIYLWHWPLFVFGATFGAKDSLFVIFIIIFICLLLSHSTYKYVELPFWKGGLRNRLNPTSITIYFILTVALFFMAGKFYLVHMKIQKSSPESFFAERYDFPILYMLSCDSWYNNDTVVDCAFGEKAGRKKMVLLGDSIGVQWFSAFFDITRNMGWSLRTYTKSACPIVDQAYFYPLIKKEYDVCSSWREKVIREIQLLEPELLIIGSSKNYPFSEKEWVDGSRKVIASLENYVDKIVIIPGTPTLDFDGPTCLARPMSKLFDNYQGMFCRSEIDERSRSVSRYLASLAQEFDKVDVMNLNDLVCSEDAGCLAINEQGVVVFRDSQHLTNKFVKSKSDEIERRLKKLLSK